MNRLMVFASALILGANCANHNASQLNNNSTMNHNPGQVSATPLLPALDRANKDSNKAEAKEDVPPTFHTVDFKNLSYPISWKHQTIPLKDGHVEYFAHKYLGNGWFDFEGVDYIDLTGDKNREAVVRLHWVSCGASCDGGSHLFYFYSIKRGKLRLLSRLETGSLAYDCALKSFDLSKRELTLELFRTCRFNQNSFVEAGAMTWEDRGGKYIAQTVTRFNLVFVGTRFVLKRREVLRNSEEDIGNYRSRVIVSND
jgi:hypothetical protein